MGLLGYSSPRIEVAAAIGILPYHLGDLALRLTGARPIIGEPERLRVAGFLADHWRNTQRRSPLFGKARGKNLIVINAESLQAFPLDLNINGQPVTPRLSAFARESLHFVNFYDQTHLGTTSDAEFATLHSLHPLAVGVLSNHFRDNRFRGLPRILAENGYATVSACAAQADFWNMRVMHAGLGFQRWVQPGGTSDASIWAVRGAPAVSHVGPSEWSTVYIRVGAGANRSNGWPAQASTPAFRSLLISSAE